jgi:hypothetical protein
LEGLDFSVGADDADGMDGSAAAFLESKKVRIVLMLWCGAHPTLAAEVGLNA